MNRKIFENILIRKKSGRIQVVTEPFEFGEDEAIIEILFTLTGTEIEKTFLKIMSLQSSSVFQTGYSSIGTLKNPSKILKRYSEQELFLLPPYYQKYIKIDNSRQSDVYFPLLRRVSAYEDKVDLLFLPILCAGLFACELISDYETRQLVLVGENLLVFIVKYILEKEYKSQPIKSYRTILKSKKNSDNLISAAAKEPNKPVFILFNSEEGLINQLDRMKIEYLDFTKQSDLNWYSKARMEGAMQMLPDLHGLLELMVSSHVHVEDIDNIIRGIDENRYKGKAIIFDW